MLCLVGISAYKAYALPSVKTKKLRCTALSVNFTTQRLNSPLVQALTGSLSLN